MTEAGNYNQSDAKKQKLAFGFGKKSGADKKKRHSDKTGLDISRPTVTSVFNADEEDEPEEMPAEARMRMRNI
ncbi:hypothetical protein WN48_02008 [Eufriesea mexicana]|uniref:PEST proteolytic signal-containing nuclear protein n=1 Tax=Eufriesea mexicana TaxID=516756 RepID=A0A310SQW2_9HYME|nr:hypothetical protein WN48_02008 [Eufriesea mexicana]